MPQELLQVSSRRTATRVLLMVILGLAIVWCYFVFRWYLGNTLAEYFNTAENNLNLARLATTLAPNDPLPHWRLGQVYQQKLTPDQASLIVAEYEKAVALSPNDYRFWMALGGALEQVGDTERAERALRQALALAPAYSLPRWYLGNLLLRSGRYDEAFSLLRTAAEADNELRPQLFLLAVEIYGDDANGLRLAIGDNAATRAEFALYLVGRERIEDGLGVWNSLSEADKKTNHDSGASITNTLVSLHRFHEAMTLWNSLAPNEVLKADIGRMVDGSFEETISHSKETVFGWQVGNAPQVQVGIDPQTAHNGNRSLRLVFQVHSKLDTLDVHELVPVAAATQYEFECYVKTAKLQSADTPFIQIVDAADGTVLGTSSEAPNGDSDWTRVSVSFKTKDKTEAVTVGLARTACVQDKICPIFGAIWYDDFSIKRRD